MDDNGITIVRGDAEFTFQNIGNAEGFEYPSTRPVIEDISGPQSSIWITSKFGRRPISFQFTFLDDFLENRRTMGLVLRQGVLALMKFGTCDNLDLQAYIQINKVLMPYRKGRTVGLIEAVAPDWRFYSQTLHTNDSNSAEQTIENAGNELTEPVFRLKGPFTAVTVRNLSTSEEFTVTETIIAGEYIDVDVVNRTIIEDDGTSRYSSFDGEFVNLIPGDNILEWETTGGGGGTSLLTTWRDAYVGI